MGHTSRLLFPAWLVPQAAPLTTLLYVTIDTMCASVDIVEIEGPSRREGVFDARTAPEGTAEPQLQSWAADHDTMEATLYDGRPGYVLNSEDGSTLREESCLALA
jgi:hypothetical protein